MWLTPNATARRSTASAWSRAGAGRPPGPASCIAPKPRRATPRPPRLKLPPDRGPQQAGAPMRLLGRLGLGQLELHRPGRRVAGRHAGWPEAARAGDVDVGRLSWGKRRGGGAGALRERTQVGVVHRDRTPLLAAARRAIL